MKYRNNSSRLISGNERNCSYCSRENIFSDTHTTSATPEQTRQNVAEVIYLPTAIPPIAAGQRHIRWIFRQDYGDPYEPDRIARSMKELLVLLEDELHARQVNLEILTGICAGFHRPNGQTIADKMLFMVAAMAAEMERDLIQERTLDGLAAAAAKSRRGGRPTAVDADTLAVARARQAHGESITAIAAHLGIGRSTLYRALTPDTTD